MMLTNNANHVNNIKFILLAGIIIGALALSFYLGYEKKKQVSLNLVRTQVTSPTPSTLNSPATPIPTQTITPITSDSGITDKILKLYDESINSPGSGLLTDYTVIGNESNSSNPDYAKEIISFYILKNGKEIGAFKGNSDFYYTLVYADQKEIFLVASCGGIGGICRGEISKFDIGKKEKVDIVGNTIDFFLSSDKRHLIYFTLDDNWLDYHLFIFNFELGKTINQTLKFTCEIGDNIRKGCRDLFLENNGEIIYLPLDYKDVGIGTAYRLIKTDGLKVEKFMINDVELSKYKIIPRISF